jgi:hypothetical protein
MVHPDKMEKKDNFALEQIPSFQKSGIISKETMYLILTPHPPSPYLERLLEELKPNHFRNAPNSLNELEEVGDGPEEIIREVNIIMGPTFGDWAISEKHGDLDKKYPHKCYNKDCNKEIKSYIAYTHAFQKYPEITLEIFKKWWKDKRIQFYCCACFAAKNPKWIKVMI